MFDIVGKFNTATVFAENIESEAYAQLLAICNQEIVKDEIIRIMPDCHAGAGCTIGTTMTMTNDKAIPNLVGVDICCGVAVCNMGNIDIAFDKLDKFINNNIPMGFNIRKEKHRFSNELSKNKSLNLNNLVCRDNVDINKGYYSIGSLGGGNHFIEIDVDETTGEKYLVIHSGSRHLGYEICRYYQNKGYKKLNKKSFDDFNKGERIKIIEKLKQEGREKEIEKEIQEKLSKVKFTSIPKDLCYIEGDDYEDYLHDMEIIQKFAEFNRYAIMQDILDFLGVKNPIEKFTTLHNYIDLGRNILRKGAVSANYKEKLIIPMNMRDGSLICIGKGNPNWNYSAPHGAGRLMSRSKAKNSISLEEFKESMKNVYSSSIVYSVIDEAPMAYKPMEDIVNQIGGDGNTVELLKVIKPLYICMAKE